MGNHRHPFKGEVRLSGEKPRTRYVEDWETVECLSLEAKRTHGSVLAVQAYIRVKVITGLRRGDLLRLSMSDLQEDGIHVTPAKTAGSTGKSVILTWTDELREAVEMAKRAPRAHCQVAVLQQGRRVLHQRDDGPRWRMGFDVEGIHGSRAERDAGEAALQRA